MSAAAIFYLFVLPILIAVGGLVVAYLNERSMKAEMEREKPLLKGQGVSAQANLRVVYPESVQQAALKHPAE